MIDKASHRDEPNASEKLGRKAYSLKEVQAALGVCRTTVWAEIRSGRLRSKILGRRRLILAADLESYLAALPSERPNEHDGQLEFPLAPRED
jgi:excisionase family DNA binding protein